MIRISLVVPQYKSIFTTVYEKNSLKMSTVKRKLKTLSLAEKLKVLKAVKTCQKKKDVAEQFGIPMSTLSTILKNESDIMKKIENGKNLSCKRQRIAKFPGLEEYLINWFKQCQNQNISISGSMVQEKAEAYSKSLGLTNFKASNGWLEKFKRRHELVFKKVYEESASVKNDTLDKWKSELQDSLQGYELENIKSEVDDNCIQLPAECSTVKSETGICFENFNICDDEVITSGVLSDEVIGSFAPKNETNKLDDIEDSKNVTSAQWVSVKDARTALNTLRNFIEQTNNLEEKEFSALYILENSIDREHKNYLKHKK